MAFALFIIKYTKLMQSHMENFTKIHFQISFAYPCFHLCNIMVNFFFLAYVTFYLFDEGALFSSPELLLSSSQWRAASFHS